MTSQESAWAAHRRVSHPIVSIRICSLLAMLFIVANLTACAVSRPPEPTPNPTRNGLQSLPHPATVTAPTPEMAPANASTTQYNSNPNNLTIEVQTPSPVANAGSSSTQNLTHYQIALDIDYDNASYQGVAQVDTTNNEGIPLDRLYFRLLPNGGRSYGDGSLDVEQVLVDSTPAEIALSLQDSVLEVKLPRPLQPGERASIELTFAGRVPSEEEQPSGYGIFNATQGIMALSGWYPILAVYDEDGWNLDPASDIGDSVYSDASEYSVEITAPKDVQVIATGTETNREEVGERVRLYYEAGPARDFTLIMSPDYQEFSRQVGDTQINSYYLPGDETSAQLALSVAADSLQIYNERFGSYPSAEFDLVEAPLRYALGVEFPELVFIGRDLYRQPGDPVFATTIAHEIAHQWWYNGVGNDVFDEPWLDEALATYSSSLYYEFGPSQSPPTGLYDFWQGNYEQLLIEGKDDRIAQNLSYFESLNNPRIYSRVVYSKGALFFQALREEIGDQAFFQALKDYYQSFRYKIATGEDLLSEFEISSGRQLVDFYNQWLYTGNPK